jgi:hypothetical protein
VEAWVVATILCCCVVIVGADEFCNEFLFPTYGFCTDGALLLPRPASDFVVTADEVVMLLKCCGAVISPPSFVDVGIDEVVTAVGI